MENPSAIECRAFRSGGAIEVSATVDRITAIRIDPAMLNADRLVGVQRMVLQAANEALAATQQEFRDVVQRAMTAGGAMDEEAIRAALGDPAER